MQTVIFVKGSICERTGINQLEVVIVFRIKYQQHINCILIYLPASRYLTDYFYSYCFGANNTFSVWKVDKVAGSKSGWEQQFLCCESIVHVTHFLFGVTETSVFGVGASQVRNTHLWFWLTVFLLLGDFKMLFSLYVVWLLSLFSRLKSVRSATACVTHLLWKVIYMNKSEKVCLSLS